MASTSVVGCAADSPAAAAVVRLLPPAVQDADGASISYTPQPGEIGTYKYRVSTTLWAAPSYTVTQSWPIMAYADVTAKLYERSDSGTYVFRTQTSGRPGNFYFQGATARNYRVDVVNSSTNIPVNGYTLVIRPPATRTADLDLQLLNASGQVLVEANEASGAESLAYAGAPAGNYTLRVIARQYAASFTVDYAVPSTQTESKVYDEAGRLWKTIDAAGTTIMGHDNANRLTSVALPAGGGTRTFAYDPDGQVKTITDATGTQSFTYDVAARLDNATDQAGVLADYSYDAAGNEASLVRAGATVTSGYDAENRLATRTTTQTASFGYTDTVNRTQITAGSGELDAAERNLAGQVDDLTLSPAAGQTPRTDLGYTYDPDGNRTARIATGAGGSQTTLATFGYDDASRLISETYRVAGQTKTVTYGFDAQGNRSQMSTAAGTTTYTANPAGQLVTRTDPGGATTAYFYDARGNLAKTIAAAGVTTYSWTPDNRLASVAAPGQALVSFAYDADGTRRTKTVGTTTTTYAWEQGRMVSEQTGAAVTRYTYDDAGAPLTITLPSGAIYTYHYDEGGSVIEVTDANKNVAATYVYDAWGNVMERSGTEALLDANAVLYRGRLWRALGRPDRAVSDGGQVLRAGGGKVHLERPGERGRFREFVLVRGCQSSSVSRSAWNSEHVRLRNWRRATVFNNPATLSHRPEMYSRRLVRRW